MKNLLLAALFLGSLPLTLQGVKGGEKGAEMKAQEAELKAKKLEQEAELKARAAEGKE